MKRNKILIFCLCLFFIFLAPAQAQRNIPKGTYSNFFSSGAFSLNVPKGFKKKATREFGVLFVHKEKNISLDIQCTKLSEADPEIFERLRDEGYQTAFVEGLSRQNAREYSSWQLFLLNGQIVFQLTSIDKNGKFNPTRALLFQNGDKEFIVTLGTETPAQLDEYDYLLTDTLSALQI